MIKKSSQSLLARFVAWRGSDYVALIAGIGLLFALVLPTITSASIWFDEAFSSYITQFSFYDIARYTATDVHPPLYYWLLKAWESVFGYNSELAIRSMSLLFAAIATVFGFLLLRRLFGRKAAVLGLLFVVLSPVVVRYSAEARMYMVELTIILAATYTMVRALEQKKLGLWVVYGVLVGLGMWVHYFTALAWLAHWAWRLAVVYQLGVRGKAFAKRFFSKEWITAHVIAIAIFLPWIPFMLYQLGIVQSSGFWIGPVGVDTPVNYVTTMFYYLDHGEVKGWFALALSAVLAAFIVMAVRVYRSFDTQKRQSFLLILALAVVPVALLIIASLPPLRSSFVERYLIPSIVATMLLFGIVAAYGLTKYNVWQRIVAVGIVVALLAIGINNTYHYGNFNKNSDTHILTRQVVEGVNEKGEAGEPIIANSPWIFYEAVFYNSSEHPVYFIDADTDYWYGSLDMLKNNAMHKIVDVDAFIAEHPTIWYLGNTGDPEVTSERTDKWQALQTISTHDDIQNVNIYKATQYRTSAE